ncbi:hypothetical protein AVEN_138149-1 [Araneus ventricosus]|uniref:Peptide toxin T-48 n=1 Tax=Araneus ventricosus TaxID=182803 RepID=K4JZ61_ARAVE|nr:peptide toxin T-48 [Araneus ventricosus]GBM37100.1 hypothetical protein AVEN_138149-1 [Araneus ventricosus]
MQKLVIAVVFMLLANLVICFEAEGGRSSFTAHLSESDTEVARADQECRKGGERCDSAHKCCEGSSCSVLIMGLGYMGSVRCSKPRKPNNH